MEASLKRHFGQKQHIRAGPHLCCITDADGRIIFRNVPDVTQEFNAEGFVSGIVDAFRRLRSSDYEFFAGELTSYVEAHGEGPLWSVIAGKTTQEIGMELRRIADSGREFDGCSIEQYQRS